MMRAWLCVVLLGLPAVLTADLKVRTTGGTADLKVRTTGVVQAFRPASSQTSSLNELHLTAVPESASAITLERTPDWLHRGARRRRRGRRRSQRGGAPCLAKPTTQSAQHGRLVNAVVLSGGSAGWMRDGRRPLAGGARDRLAPAAGRVPIVTGAILFDLGVGTN
jgi:hypothetical protein